MSLRKIRITLAAIFLAGLTLLFLDFTGTAHRFLGWMAKVQALEAILAINVIVIVALAAVTLIFGRIYCSVVCPLGVMQDIFGWLGRKARKNRYSYSPEVSWLRYAMLCLMVIAFIAGIGSIVQLLAPYSAFGRIATMLLQPLWKLGNNMLASMAERADSYTFYSADVWMKSLPVFIIAIVTLAVLAVLAWRGGRTYCNTICPVGTLLSFAARHSWLKIQIDVDKCHNCSLCARNCKASCIDYKSHTVDYSRCVVCGDCIGKCKSGALKYAPTPMFSSAKNGNGQAKAASGDASRRAFLLGTGLAATAVLAQDKHVDGGLAAINAKQSPKRLTPLTPPGSLSAGNMARRCTGCQMCVSECPNDVLRPSTSLTSLMQPVMEYDRGYCRPECTRCSDVCPAGAIKPIDKEEKSSIQIGHAIVVVKECISAQGKDECGNCARHCPAGAITMVPTDKDDDLAPLVPAINEGACIGCGACEYVCPVRPLSAIHVEGHETHKHI